MVSGLSAAELAAAGDGATPNDALRPMLWGIGLFVGGFTVVFVALGATASSIGRLLKTHDLTLSHVSGVLILVFGVVLLIGVLPGRIWTHVGSRSLGLVTRVTGERRFDVRPSTLGTWAAPVMGMAFAFAWTPCLGPVLGAVLGLAANNGTLAGGVLLLFAYSIGLALPFVATGLAFGRLTAVFARARRGIWVVELVGAMILIIFGVLLLTDNVTWVSTQFSHLLHHLGLGRLSTS
jgi:cytochrome c-type biogenesis protein